MKPKVSIIIPVYKVEKYLKRCLDSVLNQSLKEIEVILIDDGSPDKCGDICDSYAEVDSRIKVIHKENAGVSSARNSGLALATGEYIGFVDSDDYVAETMFEDMYRQAILADAEMAICQFACTDGETADLSHKRSYEDGEIFKLSPTEAFEVIADFSINVRVTVWNKIYKRELIQDLNFDIQKRMAEDFEFLMRVLVKCSSIVYIPYALYAYFTQRKGAATFHGDNDIDWYLEQNANVTAIMDEVAQSSREMRKLAVGYKCVYGDLSIVNALVRKGQLNSEVAKNVRKDLRRNFFVVMQSKLNFIKKIQISLFIVSPALYKALMRKMIGA